MRKFLTSIFAVSFIALSSNASMAADVRGVRGATVKLHGGIEAVNYALQAAGITLDGERLPALVSNVRMGSPSAYAGLVQADKLLLATITRDRLNVLFERSGKRYAFSVQTSPIDLAKSKPALDLPSKPLCASVVYPRIEHDKYKVVSNYDLIVVIDTSGSMAEPLKTLPISKWEWCTRFVSSFATDIDPFLNGRGITIVRYSDSYSIYPRCSPSQVLTLFRGTDPEGSTNIGDPLQQLLDGYLASKRDRPLLITILTDGVPTDGPKVEEVIISATKKMHSQNEVQLTFLEVGDGNEGATLLRYLDSYLVADGAKFDVVKVMKFSELKHMRLVDVLAKILGTDNELEAGTALRSDINKLKANMELERAVEKNRRQLSK